MERRPYWGYIRPDGTWIAPEDGQDRYAQLAWEEVRRVHFQPAATPMDALLRAGYVRVRNPCQFSVWRWDDLTKDARAEIELAYLLRRCEYVFIDEAATNSSFEIEVPLPATLRDNPFLADSAGENDVVAVRTNSQRYHLLWGKTKRKLAESPKIVAETPSEHRADSIAACLEWNGWQSVLDTKTGERSEPINWARYGYRDYKPRSNRGTPAELRVFDFDSTLLRSPFPPQGYAGPWWTEAISLCPPTVPEHPSGRWWIMPTVQAARKSVGEAYTILLTGRLEEFRPRIEQLTAQVGLRFDAMHLSPGDSSTLEYKQAVLASYLARWPGVRVKLWDDLPEILNGLIQTVRDYGSAVTAYRVTAEPRAAGARANPGVWLGVP